VLHDAGLAPAFVFWGMGGDARRSRTRITHGAHRIAVRVHAHRIQCSARRLFIIARAKARRDVSYARHRALIAQS
jgi:hypothetical protein